MVWDLIDKDICGCHKFGRTRLGNVFNIISKITQMTTVLVGHYFSLNVVLEFVISNCGCVLEWFNNIECSVRVPFKYRKNPEGWLKWRKKALELTLFVSRNNSMLLLSDLC